MPPPKRSQPFKNENERTVNRQLAKIHRHGKRFGESAQLRFAQAHGRNHPAIRLCQCLGHIQAVAAGGLLERGHRTQGPEFVRREGFAGSILLVGQTSVPAG